MGELSWCLHNEARKEEFRRIVELASMYRDLYGIKWLDFGCKTGEMGEICRNRYSVQMFRVEVSEDYASRADALWGGGKSVRASIFSFLSGGHIFDVISSLETLEHIVNPWETVSAFRQALSPDGLLIVLVPSDHYFRLKYYVFKAFRLLFSKRFAESI